MNETVYSSKAELRDPLRFFAEAGRDLRRSPAVAWRLFRSNLQARHRRAWLGYLWLLLPTVGTTLVWVYVRSRGIISITPTDVPYLVYVLAGTIFWQVFLDSLNAPLQQLTTGRHVITRSRVPHEALIFAGLFEVLLNCVVRLFVLAVALVAFAVPVGRAGLLVPFGIGALVVLGLAIGLFVVPAGILYDDVGRAIVLVSGFWFFLTPVIYRTPAGGVLSLNPVTPLLETTRAWLTSGQASGGFATVTSVSFAVLIMAWLFLRLARPHLVARLG